ACRARCPRASSACSFARSRGGAEEAEILRRLRYRDRVQERVERRRLALGARDRRHKAALGQFFTPAATARLMAGMAEGHRPTVRLLDAGAGVGSLTAAWVASLGERRRRPRRVTLTAHEIDEALHPALRATLADCAAACADMGVACRWEVRGGDFIAGM